MMPEAEIRETYYQCCWCKETFPDVERFIKHYKEKFRAGDDKHTQWVRLYKVRKNYMPCYNCGTQILKEAHACLHCGVQIVKLRFD